MALYNTEIQFGGQNGEWRKDSDLQIVIGNRSSVVPQSGRPAAGTQVTWSGPQGSGNVLFFEDGARFQGAAVFPGEGPVGYRGTAAS